MLNISKFICNAATFTTEMQNVPKEHMSSKFLNFSLRNSLYACFSILFLLFSSLLFFSFFALFNQTANVCSLYACGTAMLFLSLRILNPTSYSIHPKAHQNKEDHICHLQELFNFKELKVTSGNGQLNSLKKLIERGGDY